jgi:hypothetical protein
MIITDREINKIPWTKWQEKLILSHYSSCSKLLLLAAIDASARLIMITPAQLLLYSLDVPLSRNVNPMLDEGLL